MTGEAIHCLLQLFDYYAWNGIPGLAISPDGRGAVYLQRSRRKAKNDHYTNLWIVETDGFAPLRRLIRNIDPVRLTAINAALLAGGAWHAMSGWSSQAPREIRWRCWQQSPRAGCRRRGRYP